MLAVLYLESILTATTIVLELLLLLLYLQYYLELQWHFVYNIYPYTGGAC